MPHPGLPFVTSVSFVVETDNHGGREEPEGEVRVKARLEGRDMPPPAFPFVSSVNFLAKTGS